MKNKKKIITSVGVIVLFILVLGISYAFFTLTLRGNKDLDVTVGTLSLQYKDENAITLEKTYPISDREALELSPYEFRIENTGNVKALYDIILEENEENTLNHIWLKYSLKRNEEEWSVPKKITSLKLEEGLEIDPESIDSYQLRLWIDEEVGNEAQNKSFKAKVVINSVQSNASTSDLTPPTIRLNGSLSESVEQNKTYTDPGVESVADDRDELNASDVRISYKYFDGEKTIDAESIDTSRLGVYSIYYKIKDKSGNEGRVIRCVNVYKKNTVGPVIQLNGKSVLTIKKGSTYQELGARASKNGEDLTSSIVVSGEVNTNEAGTYEVAYTITDEEGNTASVVRVVHVVSISDGFQDRIKLDLNGASTDRIHLEGENLGNVTYTSSDERIASVDSDGNVEGHEPGKTVIKVTTSTGVEKEVQITVVKTVIVTYEKQGSGVSSIGKASDSCEVTTSGGRCEVAAPSIDVNSGYTAVGWNTERNATTGIPAGDKITLDTSVTYYTISYQNEATYTVDFNGNGNTIEETSRSCTIDKVYNGEEGSRSCSVTTPVITAPSETPIVVGYHEDESAKTSQIGSGETLVLNESNHGKTYYAITKKDAITYAVNFNANGNTIDAVSKECSIAAAYNGVSQAESCRITTPVITAPSETPTVVGYHEEATAKTSQVESGASFALTSSIHGKTYYAITKKDEKTITITFDKNGAATQTNANGAAVSDATVTRSCHIAAVYNGASQATTCRVTSPGIVGSSNTPTVIGYSTAKGTHSSSWNVNVEKEVSANSTYYAQTTKASVSYTATFQGSGVISSISKNNASCTIAAVYNGQKQNTSCTVTTPYITPIKGYAAVGWNYTTSPTEVTSVDPGDSISISKNLTLYGIAKPDTTKPVWSLVSTYPSSGNLSKGSTLTVTFKGTDNSGSVTSTLSEQDMALRIGSTYFPIPSLSGPTNVTGGKQYSFSIKNEFPGTGVIAVVINADTLSDGAGNKNVETVLTTAVTAQ